uniref:Uncharacterized protein n=1 Tax=Pararge aegeria TaxID=116150 RepID=S4PWJ8_9NEOP
MCTRRHLYTSKSRFVYFQVASKSRHLLTLQSSRGSVTNLLSLVNALMCEYALLSRDYDNERRKSHVPRVALPYKPLQYLTH